MNLLIEIGFLVILIGAITTFYWAINARIYRIVASKGAILASPILAPGVVFHELAHFFSALILFRKILSVRLYSFDHSSGELGHVSYAHKGRSALTYIYDAIIGLAPIFGGVAAIYFTTDALMNRALFEYAVSETNLIIMTTSPHEKEFWVGNWNIYLAVINNLNTSWQSILWVVLLVSTSHGLIPSYTDIKLSLPGIIIILAIGSTLLILAPAIITPYAISVIYVLERFLTLLVTLILPIMMGYILIKLLSIITNMIAK